MGNSVSVINSATSGTCTVSNSENKQTIDVEKVKEFRRDFVSFQEDIMEIITLTHGKCPETTCEIYKYGATITSWRVAGGENNIFVSKKAKLDGTKAIRGGIPVCFPQFGPWEFGAQHGFARISHDWRAASGTTVDEITGDATVTLCLEDTEETRKVWNKAFRLLYSIILSASSIRMDVEVENTNENPGDIFPLTFALHTYFNIPDVTKCRIDGAFKGLTFKDKTEDGHPENVEDRDALTLAKFTDRVYNNAPNTCILNGMHGGKVMRLEKSSGLADFVVWNPWDAGAAKMADMDDEEWKHFVCVEAAQTSKIIHIKASGDKDSVWKASHVLTLTDANTAMGSKL